MYPSRKQEQKNKAYYSFDAEKSRELNLYRPTFSRANGPVLSIDGLKNNPIKPYHIPKDNTFFLHNKLSEQNHHLNKDESTNLLIKNSQNMSFRGFQKSLNRLQTLNRTSSHWSNLD